MSDIPDPPRRDQQLGVMLTKTEVGNVVRVAQQLGMSKSNAGRYLINLGLSVYDTATDITPPPEPEGDGIA